MIDKTKDFMLYIAQQEALEKCKLNKLKELVAKTNNPILIEWVRANYDPYHCGGHYVEQMILEELGGTEEDLKQANHLLDLVGWERY